MRISDWSSDVCSSDLPQPSGWTGSLPFQGSLFPDVNETEQQHPDEDAHLDQAKHAQLAEHGGPRADEDDFQVEDDERDGDEVVADAELHPRVLKRGERSKEHTSELQSPMPTSYSVFSLT